MTKVDSPQCCESSHFREKLTLLRNEQVPLRATVPNLLDQQCMAPEANAELRIKNQACSNICRSTWGNTKRDLTACPSLRTYSKTPLLSIYGF